MGGVLLFVGISVVVGGAFAALWLWSGKKVHRRRIARLNQMAAQYAALGLRTDTGFLDLAAIRAVPKRTPVRYLPVRTPSRGSAHGSAITVYESFIDLKTNHAFVSYTSLPHGNPRISMVIAVVDSPVTVPHDLTFQGWFHGVAPPTLAVNPAVPGQFAVTVDRGWDEGRARGFVETLLTQPARHWMDRLPRGVLTISFSGSEIVGTLRHDSPEARARFDGPELVHTLLQLRDMVPPNLVAAYPLRPTT